MGTFSVQITAAQTWTGAQTFEGLTVDTNNITITDVDIVLATGTGTKIGTGTTQKLSFFNSTPVVQEGHIADPSGGATVDAEARTAINAILADLDTYGLQAAS